MSETGEAGSRDGHEQDAAQAAEKLSELCTDHGQLVAPGLNVPGS